VFAILERTGEAAALRRVSVDHANGYENRTVLPGAA
jgi:hypothetical protein